MRNSAQELYEKIGKFFVVVNYDYDGACISVTKT